MTIIFNQGGVFWIEEHNANGSSLACGTKFDTDVEFDRQGSCVAFTSAISNNDNEEMSFQVKEYQATSRVKTPANLSDVIGFRGRIFNNGSGATNWSWTMMFLFRKSRG